MDRLRGRGLREKRDTHALLRPGEEEAAGEAFTFKSHNLDTGSGRFNAGRQGGRTFSARVRRDLLHTYYYCTSLA